MRTLYIDCSMGAAGDMLSAALIELLPQPEAFVEELNKIGIPDVIYSTEKSVKCGITGTRMVVAVDGVEEGGEHHHEHRHEEPHLHDDEHGHAHEHHHGHSHPHHHDHRGLQDIEHIVREHLAVPEHVQDDILAVFRLIAEAESYVHGAPISDIHFHEVGTMDAIADITAFCLLMDRLGVDEVIASPIHVGSGQVRCAHGILPVPAPATTYILRDIPIYSGSIHAELCTPTGAALLKHFVTHFSQMPIMKPQAIGYGMGKKDFEAANCVRAILGESDGSSDEVLELSLNVDDMTGEAIGYAMDRLFDAGALDVYTTAIGMKKSRPGVLIRVMCRVPDKEKILETIFKHTTTIGIRECKMHRYVLDRHCESVDTKYGPIGCKVSTGYGARRKKYEYEDLARIARERDLSIEDVISHINHAPHEG